MSDVKLGTYFCFFSKSGEAGIDSELSFDWSVLCYMNVERRVAEFRAG